MEDSPFTRTMMAVWTLKAYGWPARRAEFEERLTRARKWLLAAEPHTTQEECDSLIGLWLTGSSEKELRGMAQALLKRQRADGGWAQNSQLEPDAYGTSLALYSLGKSRRAQGVGRCPIAKALRTFCARSTRMVHGSLEAGRRSFSHISRAGSPMITSNGFRHRPLHMR